MNFVKLLIVSTTIALTGCSNMPEPNVEKKWEVNPETGEYEEKETYSTTIYSTEDKDMPELTLPTEKKKK